MDIRDVQTELKAMALYDRAVDGDLGPRTDAAIEALLANQRVINYEKWGNARQLVAAQQALARMRGIEVGTIDGRVGPLARQAFTVYDARKKNGWKPVPQVEEWREKAEAVVVEPTRVRPTASVAPPVHRPWPKQSGVPGVFGAPGESAKQTTLVFPYPMLLAWDTDSVVRKASCHVLCRESFEYVMEMTLRHYGIEQIKKLRLDLFGGILNVRKKRGGSTWSMHAWGIAKDIDPEHNGLNMKRAQATLDNPEYDPFWSFVLATGATSLGIKHDFDWMHYQFANT